MRLPVLIAVGAVLGFAAYYLLVPTPHRLIAYLAAPMVGGALGALVALNADELIQRWRGETR